MYLLFCNIVVVTIGFDMTDYEVAEGGTLDLMIRKSGPVDSAISFRVFSPGFIDEEWTFAAGVGAPNTITISINLGPGNDIGLEPEVLHVLTLSLVNGDSQIEVSPCQANVTITDDDSEWLCHTSLWWYMYICMEYILEPGHLWDRRDCPDYLVSSIFQGLNSKQNVNYMTEITTN